MLECPALQLYDGPPESNNSIQSIKEKIKVFQTMEMIRIFFLGGGGGCFLALVYLIPESLLLNS
jgi:hypothetical protein